MRTKIISPPRLQVSKGSIFRFGKMISKKILVFSSLFLVSWSLGGSTAFAGEMDFKPLALIPIQEGGRVKPLDTFARESVRFITGHEEFEGKSSLETMFDWLTHPDAWENRNFIFVENPDLREQLGVSKDQKRVSPHFLVGNDGFISFAKMCYSRQQKKITLNPKEKDGLAVFERLQRFEELLPGDTLTFIPLPDAQTLRWGSIGDLKRAFDKDGNQMPDSGREILFSFAGILKGFDKRDPGEFSTSARNLADLLKQIGAKEYPEDSKISLEVQFNSVKPFRQAWIIQLVAALLAGLSFLFGAPSWNNYLFKTGLGFFMVGIGLSLYGFILRCLIAGRPPVSNMYESLIWVTFGMTVFALIFEFIFKNRYFVLSGSILAVIGFVLADNVPAILDPAIQPIEPVLRSNFWLTIHVLTITLSYAAFFLSLGIGHVCLWSLWKHGGDKERLQRQTKLLYRVVQVGVVLLAAGTILGGVWANYSWGRFWGWDPKETWALIALLGYVAVLHGRLAGWLRELGFTIGVVTAFLGVLMAWYGVNFILGVGLHSYGFSKGGLPYVIGFVVAEILLMTVVGFKTQKAV